MFRHLWYVRVWNARAFDERAKYILVVGSKLFCNVCGPQSASQHRSCRHTSSTEFLQNSNHSILEMMCPILLNFHSRYSDFCHCQYDQKRRQFYRIMHRHCVVFWRYLQFTYTISILFTIHN